MERTYERIQPDEVSDKPYIFISYCKKDVDEANTVFKILRDRHIRFWYDEGIKTGVEWAEEIEEKIDRCIQFMVLISENAVNSRFVRKEVGSAVDKDKYMTVIYLSETQLKHGLHLLLNNIQAVHRSKFNTLEDFADEISRSAAESTHYTSFRDDDFYKYSEAENRFRENYDLIRAIGRGGVASVSSAIQKSTLNMVAAKRVQGTLQKLLLLKEKEVLWSLQAENCPYVPALIDWFEDDDHAYLVESYVEGNSLATLGPLSESEVVDIALKVLSVLVRIHELKIIHGDIKLKNLIKKSNGDIILIDFDIAGRADERGLAHRKGYSVGFVPPEEMSPFPDITMNYTSDLYALGKVMQYLLLNRDSHDNDNIPVRYFRKDVSPGLENIIDKMTSPDPEKRYRSAEELSQILLHYNDINIFERINLWVKSLVRNRAYDVSAKEKQKRRNEAIREMMDLTVSDSDTVKVNIDEDTIIEN